MMNFANVLQNWQETVSYAMTIGCSGEILNSTVQIMFRHREEGHSSSAVVKRLMSR